MINVFCGCKLRPQPLGISEQMELLWVYRIHKCAKSTQIFRPQPPNIRPVIHAFYFQFWFFIPEVSCVRITLPLPENPVKLIAWLDFFLLHKIARVCESLMFCGLWRRWRRAQPAFLFAFFRYACAISAYNEKKNLQMIVFAVFHNITNSD